VFDDDLITSYVKLLPIQFRANFSCVLCQTVDNELITIYVKPLPVQSRATFSRVVCPTS
jgi:hypothetical protein